MVKPDSQKRKRGAKSQTRANKKQYDEEGTQEHPLDGLLGGLRRARNFAELVSDPRTKCENFEKSLREEIQTVREELDALDYGLAASKVAPYETRVELSSWPIMQVLRTAYSPGKDHDISQWVFDENKTDEEVKEEAYLKVSRDLQGLLDKVGDCFSSHVEGERMYFHDYEVNVNIPREMENFLSSNPTRAEQNQKPQSEAGGKSIDGRSLTDRNYVRVDDEWVHIDDFLGDKWERRARDIHDITVPFLPAVQGLKTPLRAWQCFGVNKMLKSINAFNGCILGDEMGMGKTLVCIVTALLYRQEHPSSGFALVVAPKSCISGWKKQLDVHFHEGVKGQGPKTFVLEDTRTTAFDLVKLDPDFVLVTWGFLKSRFKVYERARLLSELRRRNGLGWLIENHPDRLCGNDIPPRENNVLHSDLYELIGKRVSLCFLDEAQIAKNQDSLAHKAVRSLPIAIKIPVTGSMVHNTWTDAGGIISQLSLGIFNNASHFQNVFSIAGAKDNQQRPCELAPSRKNHLLRLLLALTVSRPASVLQLPNREEHSDEFTVPEQANIEISLLVKKFLKACHTRKTDSETNAVHHMIKAQKWASNELLLGPTKPPKDEEGSEMDIEDDEAHDSEASCKGEDSQSSDDEDFKNDPDNCAELREASACGLEILMHEEENDVELLTEKEHAAWNRILHDASDEEILSPRVSVVMKRLKMIIDRYPGEKIVVFSTYVRFLDILEVAIQRDPNLHFRALRFDGGVSRVERDRRAAAFDKNQELPVMMVSKGAGGVGVDLTVASHIIQCEVWWNGNDELQAHARCWRDGQARTVHIWRVIATNSVVDSYIRTRNQRKMVVVDEFMSLLRRPDEDPVTLPPLDLEEDASASDGNASDAGSDGS